ncbi:PUG domain [Macleaya cordata]|uniref:PUG domain n=1 Tax=Macleaya cordata TaxID=56857 RepID=A0A200RBF2_MACCD|nr:PUG domain [Macleaya cordata]
MEEEHNIVNVFVIWRGKKLSVETDSGATLKEFGHKLQNLTSVKSDTMRLLVPKSSDKSSDLLMPFSDEHSSLRLQETSILEGKSIRMMGVFEDEIEEVSRNGTKADLRIAGFEEEEKRLRERMLDRNHTKLKLPQGNYIFCDFRTLQLPGIELNPPASEALRRMHRLAADPGIVAIMNKHRWRVGIMTEMAPVGYVGISPKCILGYNKNHGEEISLRLRTDDLKGFRKYESIKKTLLHELAHMVYSEHDANFYALDKQLNNEAASLDWTRSRSHTLSGHGRLDHYEEIEEYYAGTGSSSSQKLGGKTSDQLASAHASSVAAAYHRLANASANSSEGYEVHEEPDPDDSVTEVHVQSDPDDSTLKENMQVEKRSGPGLEPNSECNPDDHLEDQKKFEPDFDGSQGDAAMEIEPYSGINGYGITSEPDPDDSMASNIALENGVVAEPDPDDSLAIETKDNEMPRKVCQDLDPDESEIKVPTMACKNSSEPDPDDSQAIESREEATKVRMTQEEPDPDDSLANEIIQADTDSNGKYEGPNATSSMEADEPDPDDSQAIESGEEATKVRMTQEEPDPDDSLANEIVQADTDSNGKYEGPNATSSMEADEPDPDDQELRRIQDPVAVVCSRLQKSIEMLRSEVGTEAASVLQTLFKIIRNVIEHPDEMKFRRLRKANPLFQKNVANYKAAMEVLFLAGFNEDVVPDEIGRAETYVVLKRNDPGLLWLAKSSLEMCIAH